MFTYVENLSQKTEDGKISVNLGSQAESKKMNPYYDTRYLANPIEVGEVLFRPTTMESRQRARRAIEIAHEFEKRQYVPIPEAKSVSPSNK